MDKQVIYTIGHSTHALPVFLDLLKSFSLTCLVDVRSIAASRFNPQYNKKSFSEFLEGQGIKYVHLPEEFGARQTDPEVLDEQCRVDFERVRNSASFNKGIRRLLQENEEGFTLALMCAESEPLNCHRFSMISVALETYFSVKHILKDKTLKSNTDLETQLLKKYQAKIPQLDMFRPLISSDQQLQNAYRFRNKEIGFSSAK